MSLFRAWVLVNSYISIQNEVINENPQWSGVKIVGNFENKRLLLDKWLHQFLNVNSVGILNTGDNLEQSTVLNKISGLKHLDGEYIYILLIHNEAQLIPVYIGKTNNPLNRWKSHLAAWARGKGSYQRWRELLLNDHGLSRYDIYLMIIPGQAIMEPPIPGFPCTVGAVEYQLVGLASDAYAGYLLNQEGNRR